MIDPETFRQVMRNLASGVSIVTACLDGFPFGMTATSFTAVSLEPVLILISLEKTTRTYRAVENTQRFAVNILGRDQADVALSFATAGIDRFQDVSYTLSESGLPILDGSIGALECEVSDRMDGGDHAIFVGTVSAGVFTTGEPLLYFQRRYRQMKEE